jgi:hypothetical protein
MGKWITTNFDGYPEEEDCNMSASDKSSKKRVARKKGGGDGDAKSAIPKKRKGGGDGDAKRAVPKKKR